MHFQVHFCNKMYNDSSSIALKLCSKQCYSLECELGQTLLLSILSVFVALYRCECFVCEKLQSSRATLAHREEATWAHDIRDCAQASARLDVKTGDSARHLPDTATLALSTLLEISFQKSTPIKEWVYLVFVTVRVSDSQVGFGFMVDIPLWRHV